MVVWSPQHSQHFLALPKRSAEMYWEVLSTFQAPGTRCLKSAQHFSVPFSTSLGEVLGSTQNSSREPSSTEHFFLRTLLCIALLRRALLCRALLQGALLNRALLRRAPLHRALLHRALLHRALLHRALLHRALLHWALLLKTLLRRAWAPKNIFCSQTATFFTEIVHENA